MKFPLYCFDAVSCVRGLVLVASKEFHSTFLFDSCFLTFHFFSMTFCNNMYRFAWKEIYF